MPYKLLTADEIREINESVSVRSDGDALAILLLARTALHYLSIVEAQADVIRTQREERNRGH